MQTVSQSRTNQSTTIQIQPILIERLRPASISFYRGYGHLGLLRLAGSGGAVVGVGVGGGAAGVVATVVVAISSGIVGRVIMMAGEGGNAHAAA